MQAKPFPCFVMATLFVSVIGLADIERSTDAVAAGGYKAVNTVAAAVIAAVANGLHGREFPFVFGGDGAGFALPAAQAEPLEHTTPRRSNSSSTASPLVPAKVKLAAPDSRFSRSPVSAACGTAASTPPISSRTPRA